MIPSTRRFAVLVNPSARRAAGGAWRQAVAMLQGAADVVVSTPPTPEAMDADVRRHIADGRDAVVVVGGDGTVNRVAHVMVGAATAMGVIPLGTGNDFARALGIPADPAEAARAILRGRSVALDVGDVNGRVFCTAGLLGLPSAAALTVRHWFSPGTRTRPLIHVLRGAAYPLAGARHLLAPSLIARSYRLEWPGGSVAMRAHGVFVANTPVIGGGLVLPVGSQASDGLLEVVLIRETSRPRLLYAFVCFARGWPLPAGVLETVRVASATIECEGPEPFSADGDLMDTAARFDVRVRPASLRVLA